MRQVLLATEQFELDCMASAERQQREVEEWNGSLEAAEREVMAVEDFMRLAQGDLEIRKRYIHVC